jgi:hypothetical protein
MYGLAGAAAGFLCIVYIPLRGERRDKRDTNKQRRGCLGSRAISPARFMEVVDVVVTMWRKGAKWDNILSRILLWSTFW